MVKTDAKTNTKQSFLDKWETNPQLAFEKTLNENGVFFQWILKRNGFSSSVLLKEFLRSKSRILDAGCGNGRVSALLREHAEPATEVVGIDLVSSAVARDNLKQYKNVSFLEKDLLEDLTGLGKFDFIYCQEVLHHTLDPYKAFQNLVQCLTPDGEIAIYVYKKKAPVREYVDDYIRNRICDLPYEEALNVSRQITKLGQVLSECDVKLQVEDLEVLDIPAGEYDLQRFIYHFFMKCFWNPQLSFEDNAVINYDWYHPQLCSRHTMEEVLGWFSAEGLEVRHSYSDFYGLTVRGKNNQ